jgi:integral membrane protein (TIGR01906 family)
MTAENKSNSVLFRVFSWVVTILVPAALVLTSVRIMLTPLYINFEYNVRGFPQDPYGFTKEDRLHWADITRVYLLNSSGISYLADLRFPDGTPVYNERELHHMVDVKNVLGKALTVWLVSLGALLVMGIWARFGGWWDLFKHGMGRGGWLTLILVATVLIFVIFGFGVFFVFFHDVFFQPGTWMFLWSDTLIRLFPERFWRDIFILVGALSIGGGLALAYLTRPLKRVQADN